MRLQFTLLVLFGLFNFTSCAQSTETASTKKFQDMTDEKRLSELETATLGAGCFWCVEAVFQELKGVESVISGYTGGQLKDPNYKDVTSGRSGHAEVAQIKYDPKQIGFSEILEVFWQTHDPTTLNRQGNDRGTQYRSAVFSHDKSQQLIAEKYKAELNASGAWNDPIITEVTPIGDFYVAENYHQNYFRDNSNAPYCTYVIQPKMEKFRKVFKDKLK